MTPFSIFALLYMTAIVLDVGETWPPPVWAFALIAILLYAAFTRVTRLAFLMFLAISTADILTRFPDVANHVNLQLYLNVVIALGIGYAWMRRQVFPSVDAAYDVIRPAVQAAVVVMYVIAGFHKLNADFFNPDVSCARSFTARFLRVMASTSMNVLLVAALAVVSIIGWRMTRGRPRRRAMIVAAGAAAVVALVLVAWMTGAHRAGALERPLVLTSAFFIMSWELIGGALLAIPTLQLPIATFSWLMHSGLALVGFVDFGSLALAMLFTFVPQAYVERLIWPPRPRFAGRPVHRIQVYVLINVLLTLGKGLPVIGAALATNLYSGLVFNAAAWFLLWPLITCIGKACPPWQGVPILQGRRARWILFPTALLVAHGFTGYLGLRTAGNFSMFSNLRTEGERSNHLLLAGNPLKFWNYQDDVVYVIAIDDRRAAIGNHYGPLRGRYLPRVEFKKRILSWTRAGMTVPVTFNYQGTTYTTDDIARDPVWRTGGRDWPMRLMDFRPIQAFGPNTCRW